MSEEVAIDVNTPAGAAARLDQLSGDREWGAKFLGGDLAAKAEFDTLTRTASAIDTMSPEDRATAVAQLDAVALASVTGRDPELTRIAMERAGGVHGLTAEQLVAFSEQAAHEKLARATILDAKQHFEISDQTASEILKGTPTAPEALTAVKDLRARLLNDPTWGARLLAGDPEARKQNFLISAALANAPEAA